MRNAWVKCLAAVALWSGVAELPASEPEPKAVQAAAVPEKAARSVAKFRRLIEGLEEHYGAKCAFLQARPESGGSLWQAFFSGMDGMFILWAEIMTNGTVQVSKPRQVSDAAVSRARHASLERFPLPWAEVERMEQEEPCGIIELHMYPREGVWKIRSSGREVVLKPDAEGKVPPPAGGEQP